MKRIPILFLAILLPILVAAQSVIYVDSSATGGNTGLSWVDAFDELSEALSNAVDGDTILVARGTYLPDTTGHADPRDATFLVDQDLLLYGGFPSGGSNFANRNPQAFPTICSGDIGVPGDSTDNAYHVFVVASTNPGTLLNGFVIEYGYAQGNSNNTINGLSIKRENGAGIYIKRSDLVLERMLFKNNYCAGGGDGGAIFWQPNFDNDTLYVRFSRLSNNEAFQGAAAYLEGGGSINTAIFIQCVASNNESRSYGGAFKLHGGSGNVRAFFDRCEIFNNTGNVRGGAFANFTQTTGRQTYLTVTNSLIRDNFCDGTGGIMRNDCVGDCELTFVNSTFVGNASSDSDLIYNDNANNTLYLDFINCIFWNQSDSLVNSQAPADRFLISHSLYPYDSFPTDVTDGGNNIFSQDPLFTDAANNDYSIQACSPAVDAGINDSLPAYVTQDLSGNNRIFNTTVDMGAYESQTMASGQHVLYVDSSKHGDGSSWNEAFKTLEEAIDLAKSCPLVDTIAVATGTYYPAGSPVDGFQLPSNLVILGGYPSGGGLRQPSIYPSVLSGDIGVIGDSTDNANHVITVDSAIVNVELDGFRIEYGNASGTAPHNVGGAIVCMGELTLRQAFLQRNYSATGGPVHLFGPTAFLMLENVSISGNTSGDGTVFSHEVTSQLLLDANTVIED